MAWHTDLTPGVGEPVLEHPAGRDRVAQGRPARRRLHHLDADHGRHDDEHALLRHGGRVARVLPVAATGRRRALHVADRGRPRDREAQVVAAAHPREPVGLRRLAAADGLHDQDRRPRAEDRLDRVDGGHVVRVRRRDRQADLPAREGDRQRRAPGPEAGQDRRRLPVLARRPQLLARLVRPADELRLQRGRGDRRRDAAADPDPGEGTAAPRREHVPRARERRLRRVPAERLARLRLGQRDRRRDGQAGVEVPDAGARARRPDDDRRRRRLRRRRRRRPPRVRREDRHRPVEVPDRAPDRGGPDGLCRERQGVHRDHGRRDGHLVERRHGREPAPGLRARRQLGPVARVHDRLPAEAGAAPHPRECRGRRRAGAPRPAEGRRSRPDRDAVRA